MNLRGFPWGALAFVLAILALVVSSLTLLRSLTIALAALGVAAAVFGLPGFPSRRDRPWLVVGGLLGGSVVLLALFAPWLLNSFWAMDVPVPESDPNLLMVMSHDKEFLLAANTWADADKDAIRQDDLRIWVDSVVAGRLPEKLTSPTLYLTINLKVSQFRPGREVVVSALTGQNRPVLTDAAGRAYALVEQRPTQVNRTGFDNWLLIDQILIFELPTTVLQAPASEAEDNELKADLRFEVPASAWGRAGVCRFHITSITDERDMTPAKVVAKHKQKLLAPPAQPADPSFGRSVFARFCYTCHAIFGSGAKICPDLTDRGLTTDGRPKRSDLEFLLTSILHPSAELAKDYESSIVALTNGQFMAGIIKAQNAETVTVATEAKTLVLPRSEIDEIIPSKISMMPIDLLKDLGEHEVRSLIAYISGPGQVPMLATQLNSSAFFNGFTLDYWRSDAPLPGGEGKGVKGWTVDRGELVVPDPHGGAPAFLTSELLVTTPFRLRMQIQRGKDSGAALALYSSPPNPPREVEKAKDAAAAAPALRIAVTTDGQVELADGSGDRATTAPGTVRPDVWHDFEISVVGKQVQIKLDGKQERVMRDAEIIERCFIVLQGPAVSGQRFRFRNFDLQLGVGIK